MQAVCSQILLSDISYRMMEAQEQLYELFKGGRATAMIALEIGGGNGLQGMILGASTNMDIPTVDGDWMGRAYPTKWQTTPVVFGERKTVFCPAVMCDGNGNVVVCILQYLVAEELTFYSTCQKLRAI